MSGKNIFLGLLLLAIVAAILALRPESPDAEIARNLARKANLAESTRSIESPGIFRISDSLIAERDSVGDTWMLSQGNYSTLVDLPFAPPRDGFFPAGEPVDDTDQRTNPGYLGADACAECHRDRHKGFVETAHHLTSGRVVPGGIRGHFDGPGSGLATNDAALSFEMRNLEDRLVQTVSYDDWRLDIPMDVFTGSAKSGQTMLYWHGDGLYQTHVSYLTKVDSWIKSPGYDDTVAVYSRAIRDSCLECHITFIKRKQAPNFYHRDSAVLGISCERCHGPGEAHVQHHQKFPEEKTSKHIIQPSDLTRQQQLEICAQCHSGSFKLLSDAFSFVPGQKLSDHHKAIESSASGASGVHTSNQLTRISMSKCFQQSEMTCTTCHNPHENQRGNTKAFTQACFQCHQVEHCGMSAELGNKIVDDCIRCHMPLAKNADMQGAGADLLSVEMVDHYIRVVKEQP